MTMLTSKKNSAVRFHSDFFDQEAIDKLLALHIKDVPAETGEPSTLPHFEPASFESRDEKALLNEATIQDALNQSLDILMEDPDVANAIKESGKENLITKARKNLTTQIQNKSISDDLVNNNRTAREMMKLFTDPSGVMALEVAGIRLLEVDIAQQGPGTFDIILHIAAVIFDIFALLCTILGIAIDSGSDFVKRIANYIKEIKQPMIEWAKKIGSQVGEWISALRKGGPSSSGWFEVVKKYTKDIVSFLAKIVKLGWDSKPVLKAIYHCFKILFTGSIIKKAYYCLQIIASIILMIATDGASILQKIVLAVIQLGLLIWDTIALIDLFHVKGQLTEV